MDRVRTWLPPAFLLGWAVLPGLAASAPPGREQEFARLRREMADVEASLKEVRSLRLEEAGAVDAQPLLPKRRDIIGQAEARIAVLARETDAFLQRDRELLLTSSAAVLLRTKQGRSPQASPSISAYVECSGFEQELQDSLRKARVELFEEENDFKAASVRAASDWCGGGLYWPLGAVGAGALLIVLLALRARRRPAGPSLPPPPRSGRPPRQGPL